MNQYSKTSQAVSHAVWSGNIEELKTLISNVAKPDYVDSSGCPIIVIAAQFNRVEVIKYLVEEVHLPIDNCCKSGLTPLMRAARCGNLDVVKYLVSVGANLQLRNAVGCTALHFAAVSPSLETFKFLQMAGIPIDSIGARGRTVLHDAAEHGNPELVKHLLEGGWLPVDCRDSNGRTPLMLTADFPRHEQDHCIYFHWKDRNNVNKALKLLLDAGADPIAEDVIGRTAIHRALGNEANFKYLFERYPNFVNARDKKGEDAICIAMKSFRWHYEMPFVIRKLLSAGANANVKDEFGRTALSLAVKHRMYRVVEVLIEFGASLDTCEKNILTEILWMAVRNDKHKIVQKMIAAEADVNDRHKSEEKRPTAKYHTHLCLENTQYWGDIIPDGQSPIFEALNHLEMLKYLIHVGADVNLRDDDGCSPLNVAANRLSYECAMFLLNAGADPLNADNCGVTPLHLATGHFTHPKELNSFMELMKNKVVENFDVNLKDHEGRTPLHYAGKRGNIKGIEILISYGADINARDIHGETPAFMAIQHKGIIKLMAEAGADLSAKDEGGKTLLSRALEEGNMNTVLYIMKALKSDMHCKNPSNNTSLLHYATKNRRLEILKYIIRKKFVPIDQEDENGQTALSLASKLSFYGEKESAFQILVDAGADINLQDNEGKTPLHRVAEAGRTERVEALLAAGADTTIKDIFGCIPLHYAAQTRNEKTVEQLLQAAKEQQKSVVDEQDNRGRTPLMFSVGQCDTFILLLKEGANINVEDSDGKTVLQIAIDNQNFNVMKLLLEMGADFLNLFQDSQNMAVHLSVKAGDLEVLGQLVTLGVNLSECWWDPKHKSTLMHHAARSSLTVMKYLMSMDKLLNELDSEGHTPFHCAVLAGNLEAVKYLLEEAHATVDERDINGRTALMLLTLKFPDIGMCWPVLHFLLESGADVNAKDKDNLSAYLLAVESDNYELIETFDLALHQL